MAHHIDARQRAFEAKQYGVLRTLGPHGRVTAGLLAQRELLDSQMAANAVRRRLDRFAAAPWIM